MKSVCKS